MQPRPPCAMKSKRGVRHRPTIGRSFSAALPRSRLVRAADCRSRLSRPRCSRSRQAGRWSRRKSPKSGRECCKARAARSARVGDGREMAVKAFLRRLVVIGPTKRASAPTFFAGCVSSIASRVVFEPVPAMTLTRPRAASTQSATTRLVLLWSASAIRRWCRTGTRPWLPLRDLPIRHIALERPLVDLTPLKGVMRAVIEPLILSNTVMKDVPLWRFSRKVG